MDIQTVQSNSFSKTVKALDAVQTTDANSQVVYSVPVPQNCAIYAEVKVFVFDVVNFNVGAFGTLRGMLVRGTGNPTKVGGDFNALNNFVAPFPAIDFVPNLPDKTIDLTIIGKTSTILHWHLELTIWQNT